MSELALTELHATLRHYGTLLVGGAVALILGFAVLHHLAPPPAPVHGPVAVFSPAPVEREAQAAIDALRALAQAQSGVSVLQQPAIAVLRDTGAVKGLSNAQIAQLLAALTPKTVERVAVGTTVAGPSPAPTPADAFFARVYSADYAATTRALKDTTIKTDVRITRQEVAPSRIGSFISAAGSGIAFGIARHAQYELDLAGVERGTHIVPAASLQYMLPHTSLGVGPAVIYDKRFMWGIGAVIHF